MTAITLTLLVPRVFPAAGALALGYHLRAEHETERGPTIGGQQRPSRVT